MHLIYRGLVVVVVGGMGTLTVSAQEGQRPQPSDRQGDIENRVPSSAGTRPSEFQIAASIVIQSDLIKTVSGAAERLSQQPEIRQFAQQLTRTQDDLINALHRPLAAGLRQDGSKTGSVNLALILNEVARQVDGPNNGIQDPANDNGADARQADIQSRQGDGTSAATEANREIRRYGDERGDNGTARRRLRDALPLLRENLPEILDAVSEAIDSGQSPRGGVGLLSFRREVGEKFATSIIEEMRRGPAPYLDAAYLGFETAALLELRDMLSVAKEYVDRDLEELFDRSIQITERQLQQARQLMEETGPQARRADR